MDVSKLLLAIAFTVLLSNNAYSAIYKCTDPRTGKINFTDKPCPSDQSATQLSNTSSLDDERAGKSLDRLVSEESILSEALERAKIFLTARVDPRGKSRAIPFLDAMKFASTHSSWQKERDQFCNSRFSQRGLPRKHNEELIICFIDKNRDRAKAYLNFNLFETIEKSLREALNASDPINVQEARKEARKVIRLGKGSSSLIQGVKMGALSIASASDIQKWLDQASIDKLPNLLRHKDTYIIKKRIYFTGGMGGAESALFLLSDLQLVPDGDYGHSVVLTPENGGCIGKICNIAFD